MTRRVLTTMGSATAVAAAVGACLLLGPTAQAQAAVICDPAHPMNCVTPVSGGFTTTNGTNTATFTFAPFCLIITGANPATVGCQ